MGDEETWRQVMQIIDRYEHPVVVVSATARTTRRLITAANTAAENLEKAMVIRDEIEERHQTLISNLMNHFPAEETGDISSQCYNWIKEQTGILGNVLEAIADSEFTDAAALDAVASTGEQLSSYLFACCAPLSGLNTRWIDARRIVKTDSAYGRANPDIAAISRHSSIISKVMESGEIPVIGGYYGENDSGEITTLGFEGSDFTASLIGSALNAQSIEIWTDVSGIYTCDPRTVPEARPIPEMTFREATELAYFGAKVLHPSTMKPASQDDIPIQVKNIFEPGRPGTRIHHNAGSNGLVRAMTFMENIEIITVTSSDTLMGYRFLSRVFSILDDLRIPVDVVTTTEASVSVALETHHFSTEITEMLEEIGEVSSLTEQGLISLIGCTFEDLESISHHVFNALDKKKISMVSFSRTKRNLNLVLGIHDLVPAVKAIHNRLF